MERKRVKIGAMAVVLAGAACMTWALAGVGVTEATAASMGGCGEAEITELFTNYKSDVSEQFVEFYNPTAGAISLTGCVVRTKYSNKVVSAEFGEVMLRAGEYQAYSLQSLGLQIAKSPTIERVMELVGGDAIGVTYGESVAHFTFEVVPGGAAGGSGAGWSSAVVVDRVDLPSSKAGKSWALVGGGWVSATPTPSADNRSAPEFAVAEDDGEGEGGVGSDGSGSASGAGAVSPEMLAPVDYDDAASDGGGSAEKEYADCGEGRYRNPETNRCKKIETEAESTLKPCAEGYERNLETNRCRKVRENAAVEYVTPDSGGTGVVVSDVFDRVFRDEDGYLQGWKVVLAVLGVILITGVGLCYVFRRKLVDWVKSVENPVFRGVYGKIVAIYQKITKKY